MMNELQRAIESLEELRFSELLINEIYDSDEVLMMIYAAVVCFNSEKGFDILLRRNSYFRHKKEWHSLFT